MCTIPSLIFCNNFEGGHIFFLTKHKHEESHREKRKILFSGDHVYTAHLSLVIFEVLVWRPLSSLHVYIFFAKPCISFSHYIYMFEVRHLRGLLNENQKIFDN